MIGGQRQEAGENAVAVQLDKGNVTINQGMSIVQMGEIMLELQKMFIAFSADAEETATRRVDKLREELLSRFSEPNSANPEAFKDPDFQFVYRRAQETYARDGNEVTSNLLVELLAERSKIPQRDRLSLILNEATEKVGKLTDEDVAILSLAFLIFQVGGGAPDYAALVRHYKKYAAPFIGEIRENTSAYRYLESLGCVSINQFGGNDLSETIYSTYSLLFCEYFDVADLKAVIEDPVFREQIEALLVKRDLRPFNPFGGSPLTAKSVISSSQSSQFEWRFAAHNLHELKQHMKLMNFSEADITNTVQFAEKRTMPKADAISKLCEDVPALKKLFEVWPKSDLQRTSLTSVGIAIGHASLAKQAPSANFPLSTWIF